MSHGSSNGRCQTGGIALIHMAVVKGNMRIDAGQVMCPVEEDFL